MLSVKGLCTEYPNEHGKIVKAAEDVAFEVPQGKLFTLLGPSGCGKTTTLRSIAGLERPKAGVITVDGNVVYSADADVFVPPNKRGFGMVFQSYAIWPHMNVFQNAAFPLDVGRARLSRKEIEAKVMRVLTTVGLDHLADREATKLSGGQQQRLALARALVMEPKLLLLDEPLSNLDAKLRERMRFELKRLQRELKLTTIFVTHDQNEALALSDQMAVMQNGATVQIGTPRELYNRPKNTFVADFIGTANILDGVVVASTAGGEHRVRTRLGVLAATGTEQYAEGTTVSISIRPEQVTLCSGAAPAGAVQQATVRGQVFLGDRLDLELTVGDDVLMASVSPTLDVAVGDAVRFTIEARCAMFAA